MRQIAILLLLTSASMIMATDAIAQTVLRCESGDHQYHECRFDGVSNVSVRRQLSDIPCISERNWGVHGNAIWVDHGCRADFLIVARHPEFVGRMLVCESSDGRRHFCPAETFGGVVLNRRLSGAGCIQGATWGFEDRGIWVDRGCRGEFLVGSHKAWLLTCESIDGARTFCRADTRFGVRLARQLSDRSCGFDRTWGYNDRGVWVDRGCRAQFSLGSR